MDINFASRQLIRSTINGHLATEFDPKNFKLKTLNSLKNFPYSTFSLTAYDYDLSPILLLSDLSEHTKNLKFKKLCSLMLCEEQKLYSFFPKFKYDPRLGFKYEDPMSRPRITLIGELYVTKSELHKNRFLARHPTSKFYSNFSDMNFYRMDIKRAHLVGGFAHVKWFTKKEIVCPEHLNYENSESSIIEHMNLEHQQSIDLYLKKLTTNFSGSTKNWKITGIDPDGFDLRKRNKTFRFCFEKSIYDAKKLRGIFVHLHKLSLKS